MSKATRVAIHVCRAICALLTVFWTISLFNVFGSAFAHPAFFQAHWIRYVLAVLVVFIPAWGYIKLTQVASRAKTGGEAPAQPGVQRVTGSMRAFGSPLKRASFILMVFGVCVCTATYAVYQLQHAHSFVSFGDALFNRSHGYIVYKLCMWFGVVAVVVGLFGSLLYDAFLAKLVNWVRHGSGVSP